MGDILVTFIIPAHNAGDYLSRAIESILCVSTDTVEILIVENGSDDDTYLIASDYQKKYNNVKVLQSEKGVSKARNLGLDNACGRWICFVDADDFIRKGAMKTLLTYAQGDNDFCAFGYYSGELEKKIADSDSDEIYKDDKVEYVRCKMLENPTRYMTVWSKLFKTEIIRKYNIKFDENLRLAEDSDFTLKYTRHCNRIVLSAKSIYHYSIDNTSCMRTYDGSKTEEYANAMITSYEHVKYDSEVIKRAYDKYVLMHFNVAMVRDVFNHDNKMGYGNKIQLMKKSAAKDIFASSINGIKNKEFFSIRMLPFLFLKSKCYILASFIYWVKAGMNKRRENPLCKGWNQKNTGAKF